MEPAPEHTQTLDEELLLWLDHEPPEMRAEHADRVRDGRISAGDMDLLHLVSEPSEIREIVDGGHERQRAAGHSRRLVEPSEYEPR